MISRLSLFRAYVRYKVNSRATTIHTHVPLITSEEQENRQESPSNTIFLSKTANCTFKSSFPLLPLLLATSPRAPNSKKITRISEATPINLGAATVSRRDSRVTRKRRERQLDSDPFSRKIYIYIYNPRILACLSHADRISIPRPVLDSCLLVRHALGTISTGNRRYLRNDVAWKR